MKKRNLFVLSLLLPSLFSSCSSSNYNITIDSSTQVKSFIYTSSNELYDKILAQDDMVLVIGEDGCSACEFIKDPLINYIKDTKYIINWIEQDEYQKTVSLLSEDEDYKLKGKVSSATLLFFDEGKIVDEIEYSTNIYTSSSTLYNNLNSRINSSNYNVVNDLVDYKYNDKVTMQSLSLNTTTYLDSLISTSSIIEYSWRKCPDCKSFNDNFLDNYLITAKKILNRFEVAGIRSTLSKEDWKEWKAKYKINFFKDGYVPSIIKYENNELISSVLYANDYFEEGSTTINDSFWGDKVIGISGETALEAQEKAKKVEIPLIKEYLDINL
jgi:hypothetical protein